MVEILLWKVECSSDCKKTWQTIDEVLGKHKSLWRNRMLQVRKNHLLWKAETKKIFGVGLKNKNKVEHKTKALQKCIA